MKNPVKDGLQTPPEKIIITGHPVTRAQIREAMEEVRLPITIHVWSEGSFIPETSTIFSPYRLDHQLGVMLDYLGGDGVKKVVLQEWQFVGRRSQPFERKKLGMTKGGAAHQETALVFYGHAPYNRRPREINRFNEQTYRKQRKLGGFRVARSKNEKPR